LEASIARLPVRVGEDVAPAAVDPLALPLSAPPARARVARSADGSELYLENGLVRRTIRLRPGCATVALDDLVTPRSLLRGPSPEARLRIDGRDLAVGGLVGQPNRAYLTDAWLEELEREPGALRLVGLEVGVPQERFAWGRRRHAAPGAQWPPTGAALRLDFAPLEREPDVLVSVHYEVYDGVGAFGKWVTVENRAAEPILLERFRTDELAVVERVNWVETRAGVPVPPPDSIEVVTDFAFGGFDAPQSNRHVVRWTEDPSFATQVNYMRSTPCLLTVEPTRGPAQRIAPGETFEGFRAFELVHARGDRERRGLEYRRLMRTVAPWVTENPLTHHLLSSDPARVRAAIDEAAEVGFEAVILTFGSGFDMDDETPAFLAEWRDVAEHAQRSGVELGAYSLFSSRGVGAEHMIVSPEGESPTHGRCPAVTSEWGLAWLDRVRAFYARTGFDQFENDGPYPGDVDVTPRPPLQAGALDSRWVQWRLTRDLYRDLRAAGVYINAPDDYYLSGSNKCGMGYRETNWSLPRAQQLIHTRQNVYDGTWRKTPSMGWMHVPLAEYHGGGAAATIEPLAEHLDHYRRMLRANLAFGVQAHYRGPRLFDAPTTRDVVAAEAAWFTEHRDILESDVIHGRRADGRSVDWILHAGPGLGTPGMLCAWNPREEEVTVTLVVDLTYTGLSGEVDVSIEGGPPRRAAVGPRGRVALELTIAGNEMSWATFRAVGR
ncbi:MAG: alpha-galactosidase, partial [Planctomycetota bacterium]